ncbi:MAG: cupredoxin domain-containing protein [Anaerolineales bacterium]
MVQKRMWMLLTAALLGTVALSACSSGPAAPEELTVTASEFEFDPAAITLKIGEPVVAKITNTGALQHTFTIPDLDVDVETPVGQTVTVEFTPAQSGTFELLCTIPGHKEAGMIGTVSVAP